jgi:ferrous iron transport protein B
MTKDQTLTVALLGNPNTGKSTLFSGLAGVRQRIGNYPGVTVEKKLGRTEFHGRSFTIVDLPGTYSLAPRSPDEMVAVDVLLGRQGDVAPIDVVLCIVDASNLERNFYLLSQVLELGLPTVVALNMVDVAAGKGLALDLKKLEQQLPVKFVPVQANKAVGLDELKAALVAAAESNVVVRSPDRATAPTAGLPQSGPGDLRSTDVRGQETRAQRASPFPSAFVQEVDQLHERANSNGHPALPRYLAERLLLDTSGYLAKSGLPGIHDELLSEVSAARERLAKAGLQVPGIEAVARYQWAAEVLKGVVARPKERRVTLSDRIDRVLTHWFWGTLVFLAIMVLMFQAVYYVPDITRAGDLIDWLVALASDGVRAIVPDGALQSLLVTGVIGGVGGVVVFLPQIFTLFLFIAILEDCGYMARAAYLMDKLMSRIGLSGKSFIPILSSFACAVPGIMSARVIENRRDRLVTILVAPLMSCSARLPVYTLLIAAFVPPTAMIGGVQVPWVQGFVMFAMYMVGIVAGVAVAWTLKKTIFRGPTPPFVMELPSYKLPGLYVVLHRMLEQGWAFIYRAGTLILAVSVIVWGLGYFPHDETRIDAQLLAQRTALIAETSARQPPSEENAAALSAVENQIAAAHLENSFLGQMGHAIEPVVRPLGWDWRIGCAAIASFPAREVVVATLGVIYNLGDEEDESSDSLKQALQEATWHGTSRKVFNLPVALSVMVFFALCAQCSSTLVIMRRETGSWRWPAFTFVYMTALAYLGALITYQVGIRLLG